LATDELFKLGDADVQESGLVVDVEEHVHAFDGRILPVAEELWLEVVLAAKFRLGRGAGEELQNDLSFQVGRKRTSWPSHEENLLAWSSKVQVTGPALGAQCSLHYSDFDADLLLADDGH
jgi:hypothetical protein